MKVYELIQASKRHEAYRGERCVNLIASEGLPSPAVREMLNLTHDLEMRYAEGDNDLKGHVKFRHYQGQKYITEIENLAAEILKAILNCDWIDLRLVSGTHANLATFKGLAATTRNDKMAVVPLSCGAHISHDYTGLAGKVLGIETIALAYDAEEMNIDPDKSAVIIQDSRPGIVTLGGSLFPFPHPVKELSDVAKSVGAYVVYDAAHVLGLMCGGEFQDPIAEGADFVTSSTHKTFPGPQGGLVFGNCADERLEEAAKKIQYSIFPLTTSNTHLARLPALSLAALEMKLYGEALAKQTVKNARTAGESLHEGGLRVLGEGRGFTESHQIAVDVRKHGGGRAVAELLEEANIIVNKNLLPYDERGDRDNPSGIRLGFQEVTRRGFKEEDIEQLCDLMVKIIVEKKPRETLQDVAELRGRFDKVEYGFQSVADAASYLEKHM